MVFLKDQSKVVKYVYNKKVIDEVDVEEVKALLSELTYEKVKLVLLGNGILKMPELLSQQVVKKKFQEPHFKTSYRRHKKPENPKDAFSAEEWQHAISLIKKP